jgi:hypothetical protein
MIFSDFLINFVSSYARYVHDEPMSRIHYFESELSLCTIILWFFKNAFYISAWGEIFLVIQWSGDIPSSLTCVKATVRIGLGDRKQ